MRTTTYGTFTAENANWTPANYTGAESIVIFPYHTRNYTTTTSYSGSSFILRYYNNVKALLLKIATTTLRARLGNNPILISAYLRAYTTLWNQGLGYTIGVRKILATDTNWANTTNRYKNGATSTTWYADAYFPVPGREIDADPMDTCTATSTSDPPAGSPDMVWDVKDALLRALQRSISLDLILYPTNYLNMTGWSMAWTLGKYPYLDITYLNAVEFLGCDIAGNPDLSTIQNTTADETYYLGATERGVTASPIMGAIKNFSGNDIPLVEILDDHPEVGDPLLESGSGDLFVLYGEAAVGAYSQKYTTKIVSTAGAGTFEVKAEAWLDYELSLHASYDGNVSWRGTPGTLWVAPGGGFSIPAEAWQILNSEIVLNKEISMLVRGDTSDTGYPADSNEQIEIARDDGSDLPDAATWRDLKGRRTKTTVSATIDATTKTIVVRHIDPTDWPTSALIFIGDDSKIQEGVIDSAETAAVGAATITGAGLDDITISGNYSGTVAENLYITIDSAATPDTFSWGWGTSYPPSYEATGVNCSTSATYLGRGLAALWAANTGHTNTDYWTAPVNPDQITISSLTNNSDVFAVNSRVGTSLPLQALSTAIYGNTNAATGVSEGQPDRIYMDRPDLAGFAAPNQVYIQDTSDPTLYELMTIQSVATTYLDLTSNLTNDYEVGSFVSSVGDEIKFHLRLNPSLTTDEEMKLARLAVRY